MLDGSLSSDPDSDQLTYNWDFGDGNTGTGVTPTHIYTASGIYNITLTVNDGFNDSASVIATVTVINTAPIADADGTADGYNVFRNQNLTFIDTSYDPDGDTLSYSWNFGDGTTSTNYQPTHSYASSGVYNVTLVVNDGEKESALSQTTVTVTNRIPVPSIPDYNGYRNIPITFDASASYDQDGDSLSYTWNFGDGSTGESINPNHTYSETGIYSHIKCK